MSKIMVVAAHPDDEVLGCGGTLLKHSAAGDQIHLVILTDGVSARKTVDGIEERKDSFSSVCALLGASYKAFGFPDNGMDSCPLLDIVQAIESEIADFQPELIYTHHSGDLNIDHQICHRALMTACRPQPGFCVREIYAFEVNSATEWNTPNAANAFIPNHFVDISDYASEKRQLLEFYDAELRGFPHSRSLEAIEAIDVVRGATVGLHKAEAFMLMRRVVF